MPTAATTHSPLPVAVVLCGCGRADGSEITEAVSTLIHLSRAGLAFRCFAPSEPHAEVVNHLTGKATGESRNMLVEAARIARGEITPLSELRESNFSAVVFPGGFGAAKNLCTFAKDGPDCTVHKDVARVLHEFHAKHKPIALICIAPVLAARVLGTRAGGPGCTVTIGSDAGTAQAISAMGATNAPRTVQEAHVDSANLIISTPAYMCDAKPHEVFDGIGALVDALRTMIRA
jgi:enhancing lycopene biosynthesis protein 2